jgi:SAM-dependent methyltransferase
MSEVSHYTEKNRRAWNEIASVREASQPSSDFFREGGSTLDPRELQAVGDIRGKKLLHLQCATGEDTLSWTIAGGDATGVDISELQIALAQQKAAEAGLSTRFVAADIYALPPELQNNTFDFVYTGRGVLVWLPDLTTWGRIIAAALKPGGHFVLFDEHPIATSLSSNDGKLVIESDYFGRTQPELSSGWRHFQGGEQAIEEKVEFLWPLGDIVTALAQAGLYIERLEEYSAESGWRFDDNIDKLAHLPGNFLLITRL